MGTRGGGTYNQRSPVPKRRIIMGDHSYRKMQTPYTGMVDVSFSFHSGAAEDASFPGDGYVDAYGAGDAYGSFNQTLTREFVENSSVLPSGTSGSGVLGVIRLGVGLYKIILRRVYFRLFSCTMSLETQTSKLLVPQLAHPGMESETDADGKVRSILVVRIVNVNGADTDLTFQDRVHVQLKLKNCSVP
jgi:hypothetical protein